MKSLVVTKDNVAAFFKGINELVSKHVLVGIPDSTTDRDDEVSGPMTNATLGYIHENGSPARNIPERPFLIPGVEDKQDAIAAKLKQAANATIDGDSEKADQLLEQAGMIGQSGARDRINSGEFAPLAPATIRNRRRSRNTQTMRANEREYLDMVADGVAPEDAQNAAGIQPLINTAQLRNALTYVVRKK